MKRTVAWLRMWSDIFSLFRDNKGYQPYAKSICVMIMPCHEDWWWQYRKDHNPSNDNGD